MQALQQNKTNQLPKQINNIFEHTIIKSSYELLKHVMNWQILVNSTCSDV